MRPVSRRDALILGGLGLLGTATGAFGLYRQMGTPSGLAPRTGAGFSEPETLRSRGGRLDVRLRASRSRHLLVGREATTLGYNGGVPGPTLRLRPGDRLRIDLVNGLEESTNLHVHGLHVSPEGNGDNVFVEVGPGTSFSYEYRLPDDHPPGLYWYHPHHHGTVADQVFAGLYGAIVVEETEPVPVTRERVLIVSDITLSGSGEVVAPTVMEQMMGREGDLVMVNGQADPVLTARPGERERWRVVNACTSRFLSLRMDGRRIRVLGVDSGRFAEPRPLEGENAVLAPGNRADLLVTAGRGGGDLRTLPYDRGGMPGGMGGMADQMPGGGPMPGDGEPVRLARLDVTGPAGEDLPEAPAAAASRDLRGAEPVRRRRLVFAMGVGGMTRGGDGPGMSFTIDGREFDADRVDQRVGFGTVEEWTIGNDSPMDHPFHLHVWPVQVVRRGGRRVPGEPLWRDVVGIPARGEVTVRVAFDDFGGRTVYHCHILDHEDRGMMGVVRAGR
ncbi:multicopper oxidase family protein [Streptomyces sp. HK10]|uniref:multicopper oxidase family protein n=1 Tax=Streptomyces sp. HK10 TaxID=3373255 RepID=UPI0037498926